MSEFDFQKALVNVLINPKLRESLAGGDLQPLIASGIPPEQAQHFSVMDNERLDTFADMVVENRIYSAAQWMPYTTQLLGERMVEIALEFNRDLPPAYSKRQDHALALSIFLRKRFKEEPPTPPFIEDILIYEQSVMEMFVGYDRKEAQGNTEETEKLLPSLTPAAASEIVPYRRANTRLIYVKYDVPSIVQQIVAGQTPAEMPPQPMNILLRIIPPGFLEQDKVNVPTMAFINLCDGVMTLAEVIADLADSFQKHDPSSFPGFESKCIELCKGLITRQVIGLRCVEVANVH